MNAASYRVGLVALAVVSLLVRGRPASGDEPKPAEIPPEAWRLLEEMCKAYKSLPAYADEGELRIEFVKMTNKGKEKAHTAKARARLSFARPNKIALNFGTVRLFSDGVDLISVIDSFKRYHVTPAPKAITTSTFLNEWYQAILLDDANGLYLTILLTLLLAEDPAKEILGHQVDQTNRIVIEPDRVVRGKTCKCLLFTTTVKEGSDSLLGPGLHTGERLLIDADSKLMSSLETTLPLPRIAFSALPFAPAELPAPPGEIVVGETIPTVFSIMAWRSTWDAGKVSTEGLQDSDFKFQPPAGYKRVKSFEDLFEDPPLPIPPRVGGFPDGSLRRMGGLDRLSARACSTATR